MSALDQWYIPANQPATLWGTDVSPNLSRAAGGYIALRSTLPPEQMIQTLRATVAHRPPLSLQEVQPMDAAISNVEAPRPFNTALITAFALGALLLSVSASTPSSPSPSPSAARRSPSAWLSARKDPP